jgi:hypothetical protein
MRRRALGALVSSAAVMLSVLTFAAPEAGAATFSSIKLVNGWTNTSFSTRPAGATVHVTTGGSSIVTLKGAIANGTTGTAFTLAKSLRPATDVYVPLDLCTATKGRVHITPTGVATIQAETNFSNAQCFTSLEGATYARNTNGFTALSLVNGWTGGPFSTSQPMVVNDNGIIRFKGAIANGTTSIAFTLPVGMRPANEVYVPVDMSNASNGRLIIDPSGTVSLEAEGGTFSNAQNFTSLDGAWFALDATGATGLSLVNGWTGGGFSTGQAGVRDVGGVAYFSGSVENGTSSVIATLTGAFRPPKTVYVPVDLCGAANGRLIVSNAGVVTVQAENGTFSNAQCFTSLDGVAFPTVTFAPLKPLNGWHTAGFGNAVPAAANLAGNVAGNLTVLRGGIATSGTNTTAFVLPKALRPATNVFVPADLCDATNGRLDITPQGIVTVEAENGTFSNAQCFTSLEGISFARNANGYSPLTLVNGWTGSPFSTSPPAVRVLNGIVHLKGAMANGTSGIAFTLPAAYAPATNVYVPVDMCGATNGRLLIQHSGVVSVQAESSFADAQCFTSLDGVAFAPAPGSSTALTLVNGWTNAPFGTSNAEVQEVGGIAYLEGAIATGGTNPVAFTLPPAFRPYVDVWTKVDLCNATNGRLFIQTDGTVTVQAENGTFSNAACFTSLDGASFAI